jgi:hypothetical protein
LLYCSYCSSYTLLHSYEKETGDFLGEYSLLHNEYTRNSAILNKFLLAHLGHSLRAIPSKTDDYMNIICTAAHFLEDDIDKYVEESQARAVFQERNRQSERAIGRVEIYIIEQFIKQELSALATMKGGTAAEGQVLLGKELGMKRALEIIQRLLADKQKTL